MYVRLAFAAAHLEPEILIVDEVLAEGCAIQRNTGKDRECGQARAELFYLLVTTW